MPPIIRPMGPVNPGPDGYEYFSCPNAAYAAITVLNGAIDYQYGEGFPLAVYGPYDATLSPGTEKQPVALDEVRFKAHVPVSSPAPQIQITAYRRSDLPLGFELGASFTPSYAVVNADGTIGANFTGHVSAQGLDLQAGTTATPPASDRVRWLRQSDGAVVGEIYGNTNAGGGGNRQDITHLPAGTSGTSGQALYKMVDDNDGSNADLVMFAANADLSPTRASVSVIAQAGGLAAITRKLIDTDTSSDFVQLGGAHVGSGQWRRYIDLDGLTQGGTLTLLDGSNSSQFLQLLSAGNHKLAFGAAQLHWSAASVDSAQLTQPHGLGAVPVICGGFERRAATFGFRVAVVNQATADATDLFLAGVALDGTPAANSNCDIYWFAIS